MTRKGTPQPKPVTHFEQIPVAAVKAEGGRVRKPTPRPVPRRTGGAR